jgi:hypothetical protein
MTPVLDRCDGGRAAFAGASPVVTPAACALNPQGAKDGKGRGRQVIGTARTCDLILIVLDASKPMTHKRIIEKELGACRGRYCGNSRRGGVLAASTSSVSASSGGVSCFIVYPPPTPRRAWLAEGMGIRLNKRPPNIAFTKKDKGGIAYRSLYPQPHLEEELVKAIW